MYQLVSREHAKLRVLVVDDLDTMLKVTQGQLHTIGMEQVGLARNGAEALRLLREQAFDLVLSDWNMPVMSGLELLKAVRREPNLRHLPFIMITAEADRHRITEAIRQGVSDLLVKPYTAQNLMQRIERAITSRQGVPVTEVEPGAYRPATTTNQSSAGPTVASRDARGTILIVDDTPDNLALLNGLLKGEYRVQIAQNGEKALRIACSDTPPDLVLLDVMMPGIDGFEVLRRMRGHPSAEHIPVIFITAMTADDAMRQGLELGAVDYITKPIVPEILKIRVRNFMRYVDLHRQLQADYDEMLDTARLREDVEQIVRHDIKGPLAGIIGILRGLAEDSMLSRPQTEQLRLAEEATMQVANMINLSSELFKMETGRFQLVAKPIPIGDILRRIAEMARQRFKDKHLVIAVDTDVPVGEETPKALGDALLCHSLFENLLKNACEAAPASSRVGIVLTAESPLRIDIRNQGCVPLSIRARFFDKFVTHGKEAGTGLGTYSAKLLTEAQHGTIAMETSDERDETLLTVRLPRAD